MPDIDGTGKPRWPTWRGSPCLVVPLRGHQGGTARANDVRKREQIAPAGQVRMNTERAERQPTVSDQVVTYESIDGIAVITLNRPHRLNAVVPELVERLCAALGQARQDDVAACVLTGAGRSFCAGHDLRQEYEPISEAEDRRRLHRIQDVTRLVRPAPFPAITAVHRHAPGAGREVALCCDLIGASEDATFRLPPGGA